MTLLGALTRCPRPTHGSPTRVRTFLLSTLTPLSTLTLLSTLTMAVALMLTTFSVAATAQVASQKRAHQFKLDNGMDVIVIPDRRAPVVTHMVWYRVGGADEPPGVSGIAHFLEHLMFKATDKIPTGEFSKIVSRLGGQDNAFTGHDATAYFQRIAKDRLPQVMAMEADRMVNLKLAEKEVLTERDVILEERRSRIENSPAAIFPVALNIRCSRKWAMPDTPRGSSAAPTRYHTIWVTTGARLSGTTTTCMPLASVNSVAKVLGAAAARRGCVSSMKIAISQRGNSNRNEVCGSQRFGPNMGIGWVLVKSRVGGRRAG